jgi:glycosyltransferase involved in cell wall biosynthesis
MSAAPRFSVVIPSARGGAYLREAVSSVLAQSFTDFELIVIADGCEDDLVDVEALDQRIRVIRQANRGESVARNVGIRIAHGELLAFLDDDDRMLPGRLAAQIEAMESQPEAGLCHTQYRVIDEKGMPGQVGHARNVQYRDLLRGEVDVLLPTIAVRRSLLEEVGAFDSAQRTGQDLEVIYRIARESMLVFLPEILTEYRRHSSNASASMRQGAQDVKALLTKHLRLADQQGRTQDATAARQGLDWVAHYGAAAALVDGRIAWKRRDLPRVARCLAGAMRLSPAATLADLVGNRWTGGIERYRSARAKVLP